MICKYLDMLHPLQSATPLSDDPVRKAAWILVVAAPVEASFQITQHEHRKTLPEELARTAIRLCMAFEDYVSFVQPDFALKRLNIATRFFLAGFEQLVTCVQMYAIFLSQL
jgi:hypothetical protein